MQLVLTQVQLGWAQHGRVQGSQAGSGFPSATDVAAPRYGPRLAQLVLCRAGHSGPETSRDSTAVPDQSRTEELAPPIGLWGVVNWS